MIFGVLRNITVSAVLSIAACYCHLHRSWVTSYHMWSPAMLSLTITHTTFFMHIACCKRGKKKNCFDLRLLSSSPRSSSQQTVSAGLLTYLSFQSTGLNPGHFGWTYSCSLSDLMDMVRFLCCLLMVAQAVNLGSCCWSFQLQVIRIPKR